MRADSAFRFSNECSSLKDVGALAWSVAAMVALAAWWRFSQQVLCRSRSSEADDAKEGKGGQCS